MDGLIFWLWFPLQLRYLPRCDMNNVWYKIMRWSIFHFYSELLHVTQSKESLNGLNTYWELFINFSYGSFWLFMLVVFYKFTVNTELANTELLILGEIRHSCKSLVTFFFFFYNSFNNWSIYNLFLMCVST